MQIFENFVHGSKFGYFGKGKRCRFVFSGKNGRIPMTNAGIQAFLLISRSRFNSFFHADYVFWEKYFVPEVTCPHCPRINDVTKTRSEKSQKNSTLRKIVFIWFFGV